MLWQLKNPMSIPAWKGIPGELSYPEAVYSRRSKRNFIPKTLPLDRLTGLLSLLDARPKADGLAAAFEECLMTGFLAQGVEGLENGFYLCDFHHHHFGRIEAGTFQPLMAGVCLGQAWLAHAALHFLFMADFAKVDRLHGSRGYRTVMMEAGRKGQALYAGATALGLGCCGIGAFFDPEAKDLLEMNEDVFLCYLVAAGPVKL
jgi:SagB-type dehydrogenase family enzyme